MSNHKISSKIQFSLIVTCYNQESVIQNAINSIKSQSFCNYECIIVDDCSTDLSVQKIENAILGDSRFRIIKNIKNMSVYMSRRYGIREAIGDYTLFLDGDDLLFDDALAQIDNFLKKQKEDYEIIDFAYQIFPDKIICTPKIDQNKSRLENFACNNIQPAVWMSIHKSCFIKLVEHKLPDAYLNICEDSLFQTFFSYYVKNYTTSNILLVKYNLGNGISTKKSNFSENKFFIDSVIKVKSILDTFSNNVNDSDVKMKTNKIISTCLLYYVNRCKNNTQKEDIYKSLCLLSKNFDDDILKNLYPLFMFGPDSLLNFINYYGRKKIIIQLFKKTFYNKF